MSVGIAERSFDGSGSDAFWRDAEQQMDGGGAIYVMESVGTRRARVRGVLGDAGIYGGLPGAGSGIDTDRVMPRPATADDRRRLGIMGLLPDGVEWG